MSVAGVPYFSCRPLAMWRMVGKKDAPTVLPVVTVVLPEPDLDAAMLLVLGDPCTQYLDGMLVSLCCSRDDKWFHAKPDTWVWLRCEAVSI